MPAVQAAPAAACPKLGFADDPGSHFSRPTQLHRCYAGATVQRLSVEQQRQFCLSEGFGACPRLSGALEGNVRSAVDPAVPPERDFPWPSPEAASLDGASLDGATAVPAGAIEAPRRGPAAPLAGEAALPLLASLEGSADDLPRVPRRLAGEHDASGRGAGRRLPRSGAARLLFGPLPIAVLTLVAAAGIGGVLAIRAVETQQAFDTLAAAVGQYGQATTGGAATRTILDERFPAVRPGWPNAPESTAWFGDGAYHLLAREPGRFVAVGAPAGDALRDVVVSGTFRKVGGLAGGGYGLIVRDEGPGPRDGVSQQGRYYVFGIADDGRVGVWRRENDRWVDLLPWTPLPAVRTGDGRNQLTARAIGQRLTFSVNNVQVASLDDSALTRGGVGVYAGGDGNEVLVEQFTVQVPS
jgi:hypothetical protein